LFLLNFLCFWGGIIPVLREMAVGSRTERSTDKHFYRNFTSFSKEKEKSCYRIKKAHDKRNGLG